MRRARILSIALFNPTDASDPDERVRTNLDNILAMLDRAAAYDPDFVCFPELALQHAARDLLPAAARPIPGHETDAVAEKAVELDAYVVLPMYERVGETVHNAATLIDPDGDIVGTYRKVAPTHGEVDGGITPGSEIPVWDTEFGRVGICICWDARFPEIGQVLGAKGANLVFFPTHGTSHERMRTTAMYNGYHVVSTDKNDARTYTPRGNVVGRIGDEWKNPQVEGVDLQGGRAWLSFVERNLDVAAYAKASGTAWEWPTEIARTYPGSVSLDVLQEDGVFVLESLDEDLTLADLEAEFDMERVREYEGETLRRVRDAVDESPLYPGPD